MASRPNWPALLAACALAGAGLSAHGATANLTLDGWRITVTDLDGSDGIAAGYTLGSPNTFVVTIVDHENDGPEVSDRQELDGWQPASSHSEVQSAGGLGLGTADAAFGTDSLSVAGNVPMDVFHTAQARQEAPAFTIRPNTQLTFSGLVSASTTGDATRERLPTWLFFGLGIPEQGFIGRYYREIGTNESFSEQIEITVSTGASAWTGRYELLGFTGRTRVAPIPEPSTWALMLAGVVVLATCAMCRRARSPG